MVVDLVDKQLLIELGGNCRLSYQTLARYLGLTVNAVKKRINKLVDTGVIDHFAIMINSGLRFGKGKVYFLFSQVWCEELIDQDMLLKEMAKFPELGQAYLRTTRNTLIIRGSVKELDRYVQIAKFIQDMDGVTKAETDLLTYLSIPGKLTLSSISPQLSTPRLCYEFTFTKPQLQLIRCLRDNPRMQISDLATCSKLTPKRVRKILDTFQQSQCIRFTFVRNLSASGQTGGFMRITLDESQITPEDFARWVFETYPFECWGIWPLVDTPHRMWLQLSAHNIHVIDSILQTIKSASFTVDVDAIVNFQVRQPTLSQLSYQKHIDKILAEDGL